MRDLSTFNSFTIYSLKSCQVTVNKKQVFFTSIQIFLKSTNEHQLFGLCLRDDDDINEALSPSLDAGQLLFTR